MNDYLRSAMSELTTEGHNEPEPNTSSTGFLDTQEISKHENIEINPQQNELLSPPEGNQATSAKNETPTKRHFSYAEDCLVRRLVEELGTGQWQAIAKQLENRTARQVRDRWRYYLDPALVHKEWTIQDDKLLISLIQTIGKQWSQLVKFFPGRTDVNLKNHWNKLQRRAKKISANGLPVESPTDGSDLVQVTEQNLLNGAVQLAQGFIDGNQQTDMKPDDNSMNQN